jgi:protocatechuate 3,4-dioxygenase beta subunit
LYSKEYIRKDIREKQRGITLVLDIGVLDIRTCKPLPNAYVDIWHANATGFYSGFTTTTLPPPPANGTNATIPSPPMSDKLTFLRGGQPTNKNGITEVR